MNKEEKKIHIYQIEITEKEKEIFDGILLIHNIENQEILYNYAIQYGDGGYIAQNGGGLKKFLQGIIDKLNNN